jgi:hypothetical protein
MNIEFGIFWIFGIINLLVHKETIANNERMKKGCFGRELAAGCFSNFILAKSG